MNGSPGAPPTFGYLDFVDDPALGITGGYLIVSATGRPLEFHCTAPVQASRAQQILFGPTLRPHLLGELIGRALVDRAKLSPSLLLVSDADFADAAKGREAPLVLVKSGDCETPVGSWRRVDAEGGDLRLWSNEVDNPNLLDLIARFTTSIDIAEPLERIREAIREAQRLGQSQNGPSQERPVEPQEGAAQRDAA